MVRLLFLTSLLLTILNRKRSMKQEEKLSKQEYVKMEKYKSVAANIPVFQPSSV
jgi:preprotein translocase subunit SecG